LKTSDFDYDLPQEFIAQTPIEPRDASRLMVLERSSGKIEHCRFHELGRFMKAGDVLVVNQTRVIPARVYGQKIPTGGKIELLLLRKKDELTWEALVGGKGMKAGKRLLIEGRMRAEITALLDGARRLVQFEAPVEGLLQQVGRMPLPPYIYTRLDDPERYQTVFAHQPGSAAAPTAGLHFTPQMIARLEGQGVRLVTVTLHIGLDTFAPVQEESPERHPIHTEWCQVSEEAAETINRTCQAGGRVIAVGTTSVRTLETAAVLPEAGHYLEKRVQAYEGPTSLYILPGYSFRVVDRLVTNFHLPRSTLIMLVSAFASREQILRAYEVAKKEGYRFYSFGDAMLIL